VTSSEPQQDVCGTSASEEAVGPSDLITWAARVGEDLSERFRQVLDAAEITSRRPRDVGAKLGLNRDIAGRLVSLVQSPDPFEALYLCPGPEPLRKVLRAATALGLSGRVLESALGAVDDFEALIEQGAGTRGRLETTLGSLNEEIRNRNELTSRYAIFTGLSQLRGAQADSLLHTMILTPSAEDPEWLDALMVEGLIGIQRFRPGVIIHSNSQKTLAPASAGPERTRVEPLDFPFQRYCENPICEFVEETGEYIVRRMLIEAPLGRAGLRDSIGCTLFRRVLTRTLPERANPERAVTAIPALPSSVMNVDLLIHRSIRPPRPPAVRVYDMGADGRAHIHDRERLRDVVQTSEAVESLGGSGCHWALDELPRYTEMVTDLMRAAGLSPDEFEGYRLRAAYPVVSWQYAIVYGAPLSPTADAEEQGGMPPGGSDAAGRAAGPDDG